MIPHRASRCVSGVLSLPTPGKYIFTHSSAQRQSCRGPPGIALSVNGPQVDGSIAIFRGRESASKSGLGHICPDTFVPGLGLWMARTPRGIRGVVLADSLGLDAE